MEDGNLQLNSVGNAPGAQETEVKSGESEFGKQLSEIRELWNAGQSDENSESRKLIESELLEPKRKPKLIIDFVEKGVKFEGNNIIQFQKELAAFNGKASADLVGFNFQSKSKFTVTLFLFLLFL